MADERTADAHVGRDGPAEIRGEQQRPEDSGRREHEHDQAGELEDADRRGEGDWPSELLECLGHRGDADQLDYAVEQEEQHGDRRQDARSPQTGPGTVRANDMTDTRAHGLFLQTGRAGDANGCGDITH